MKCMKSFSAFSSEELGVAIERIKEMTIPHMNVFDFKAKRVQIRLLSPSRSLCIFKITNQVSVLAVRSQFSQSLLTQRSSPSKLFLHPGSVVQSSAVSKIDSAILASNPEIIRSASNASPHPLNGSQQPLPRSMAYGRLHLLLTA